MEYKESDVLLKEDEHDEHDEHDDVQLSSNILDDEEDAFDSLPEAFVDHLDKKSKESPTRFSLEKRRAIEDYLEQRRLREEFDYEFEPEEADKVKVTESE